MRYLGIPFRADLSYTDAERNLSATTGLFCHIIQSIPADKPWNLHQIKLYLNEHIYSRMEHLCSVYPLDEQVLASVGNEIAGIISRISAATNISAGDYNETIICAYLGLLKPLQRAKTVFLHNSILMLERNDVHGALARARYQMAEDDNFLRNATNNRAVLVKRYLGEIDMKLTQNPTHTPNETPPIQITIKDTKHKESRKINFYEKSPTLNREIQSTPRKPTQITVATDGSLKNGEAKYGFITLTERLEQHWEIWHALDDTKLFEKLTAAQIQSKFYRISKMIPGTAHSSYQPEALATILAQCSFGTQQQLHIIIDNTAAQHDLTHVAQKPNRAAGRLIQKLHQAAQQQYAEQQPNRSTSERLSSMHQKSHTKANTLPAFLNRCIDILLTHSPNDAFESQPDLMQVEQSQSYVLTQANQHIFGDRRQAIYLQYLKQLKREIANTSQGMVANMDINQFETTTRKAWQLGLKHPSILALNLAIITNNLNEFYTFPNTPMRRCPHCQEPEGTNSAHFFRCREINTLQDESYLSQIAKLFNSMTNSADLETHFIISQLLPLQEADFTENPFPTTEAELPSYEDIRAEKEAENEENIQSMDKRRHPATEEQDTNEDEQPQGSTQDTPPKHHKKPNLSAQQPTEKRRHETSDEEEHTANTKPLEKRANKTSKTKPDNLLKRRAAGNHSPRENISPTIPESEFIPPQISKFLSPKIKKSKSTPHPETTTPPQNSPPKSRTTEDHHPRGIKIPTIPETPPQISKPLSPKIKKSKTIPHLEITTPPQNSPLRRSTRTKFQTFRYTPQEFKPKPVPRSSNNIPDCRITAMLSGILTLSALTFIHTHIPNSKAINSFVQNLRQILIITAWQRWNTYRNHRIDDKFNKAKQYIHRRRRFRPGKHPDTSRPTPEPQAAQSLPTPDAQAHTSTPRPPRSSPKRPRPAPPPNLAEPIYSNFISEGDFELLIRTEPRIAQTPPILRTWTYITSLHPECVRQFRTEMRNNPAVSGGNPPAAASAL